MLQYSDNFIPLTRLSLFGRIIADLNMNNVLPYWEGA